MDDERCVAEKADELVHHIGEQRLVLEKLIGQAVDRQRLGRHAALGIEVLVECLAGGYPVDQLDAADLDQAITVKWIETRRLRIEHDFAHEASGAGAVVLPSPLLSSGSRAGRFADARLRITGAGILLTARRMSRTCARAWSKSRELSKIKSARRRFSASGSCLARMAANFSSVMPGRSKARWRCISAGAETTTTASQRHPVRRSNSNGTSSTTTSAPRACASAKNLSVKILTSGCTMASSLASAAVVQHHAGKLGAVHLSADRVDPGNAAQWRHGFAFIERVHDGIGIVHRNAGFGKKPRRRRFPHAQRTGQAQNKRPIAGLAGKATVPFCRRNPNTCMSGRPKTVKYSPSTRSNN